MIRLSIDDAFLLLGAIVRRALSDVRSGTPTQRADAVLFLDHICPRWQDWPQIHQQRAATLAAQRLAAAPPRRRLPKSLKCQHLSAPAGAIDR